MGRAEGGRRGRRTSLKNTNSLSQEDNSKGTTCPPPLLAPTISKGSLFSLAQASFWEAGVAVLRNDGRLLASSHCTGEEGMYAWSGHGWPMNER